MSDDAIQSEGSPVFGETVDVADLLLEVTDHARPSCSRTELVELWKQRTPDLPDSAASEGMHCLREALLFLEGLDMIARVPTSRAPRS